MGIRDEELKRLEYYAKGMGIKVSWKAYVPRSNIGGEWAVDGSEITLYIRPKESKLSLVLKFVHELGHHKAWINSGKIRDLNTENALISDEELSKGNVIPKEQRKLIYIAERDDSKFRQSIYDEVGLRVPRHIFLADIDLDIWLYYRYYLTGKLPSHAALIKKKRELVKKYKNNEKM